MQFKMINLKRVRDNLLIPDLSDKKYPGRRNFIRTMGLGMLALNQISRTVKAISNQPFDIRFNENKFTVLRDGNVDWDISTGFFEKGFLLKLETDNDGYKLIANGLRVNNSNLGFSMTADIYKEDDTWVMDLSIPELDIKEQVDFLEWLDKNVVSSSNTVFDKQNIDFNAHDKIEWQGECTVTVNAGWKIAIEGERRVNLHLNGMDYGTNKLLLEPYTGQADSFLTSIPAGSVKITAAGFAGWGDYLSDLTFYEGNQVSVNGNTPDLHAVAGKSPNSNTFKALWVLEKGGNLQYNPYIGSREQFLFSPYFYYSEYKNEKAPEFYLAGKMPEEGQWISSGLGSLKFINSKKYPDFEAFGLQNIITWHICELLLSAFQPIVAGAFAIPVILPEPLPVRINSASPDSQDINNRTDHSLIEDYSRPQEIRKVQQDTPGRKKPENIQRQLSDKTVSQIKIGFNEIRLEPKKAIKISLIRPEDLIQLDFEFHNFEFSNRGQGGYLQLADKKEKGTMIVFFPTQHTLEEAWFESAKIPAEGKEEVITLPARQIRAQKSRLVYELEAGSDGFPLMLEEVLNWSRFSLRVHPRAWIKLSSILKPRTYPVRKISLPGIKTADNYLDNQNGSIDFNIRLMQKNRLVDSNEYFTGENTINKLFQSNMAVTVMPSFILANTSKIALNPSPVPDDCTSIEAPALMYISPNQINDFSHRTELKMQSNDLKKIDESGISTQVRIYENQTGQQQGEIVELWHTKLGVKLKDGKISTAGLDDFKTIRVLWAYEANSDYKHQAALYKPFMTSLDASDRQVLVHQTSNFSEKFTPVPVPVRNLMLTTLGAYLNWHVFFKLPAEYTTYLNIIEWQHLATLGRDHYVKVVREGYLLPFGHKAALVKITERKFHAETRAAINRQRMYVVILEKEVTYERTDPENKFIEFPFEKIKVLNDYTPDIDHPNGSTLSVFNKKKLIVITRGGKDNEPNENVAYNFYICVANEKFKFDLLGTDKEGFEHKFQIPLVFVENFIARTKENIEIVVDKYNEKAGLFGIADLNSQKVAYAGCLVDGDTSFETRSIVFHGQYYPAKGTADLKFHPNLYGADIYLKQVEELTGKRETVGISLIDDSNAGHVFARVTGAKVDFTGGSDKSGGFLSPNMDITALSRLQGPLGGTLDNCKGLIFNAEEFFKSVTLPSAKIFGCIDIFSLLKIVDLGGSFDSYISDITAIRGEMTKIKNDILILENEARENVSDLSSSINSKKDELKTKTAQLLNSLNGNIPRIPNFKTYVTGDSFFAEYRWQPEMKGSDITVIPELLTVKVTDPAKALSVTTRLEKPFDTKLPATMNGCARFENFEVVVASMIGVGFKYLEFKTGSSQKTDVKVELESPVPISFMGPLSFVNSLQSIIPSTGFAGDGPYIDLTPTGVTAGFSISVPSVEVGICSIANISLGASVTLPFTGDPLLLAFNFCTRENPFLLTISCFGGGGFFRLITSLQQIETVEAAFEFGASLSLNVGVASGSVSAMGGIYFKSEHAIINGFDANIVVLTGYIRLNGRLSIIGLITVSMEFYMAFTANFVSKNGKDVVDKLVGEATLKVKVEVLFFSMTVSVTVRREMQGADADPKFTDMIYPEDWEEYCLAFAG
ncbi:MAG: hypothetical protein WCS03_15735 [Bacteroidota bacterium]